MPQAATIAITAMTVTIMADGPALLRLMAWLSPAFPTGAFAYSHGLEWAMEAGDVRSEADLLSWLGTVLRHGTGWSDAILLRAAHAADPAGLAVVAALAAAAAPGRERQGETLAQGAAFLAAAAPWQRNALADVEGLAYPVAVGALTAAHGISADDATAAYLQAFATSLISAAVRLVPLGQSAGLRVLAALEPVITEVASATRDATTDDLGGCCFRSDIAAMRHETQYTRLFRT